ncbi:MAG TPA: type II secretion system major pseudopilin GspG [Steroidobacteraceae bacterium]|nr:type II secretion system major pseudopilin GspG [Steroidobacteraceae bacterium]
MKRHPPIPAPVASGAALRRLRAAQRGFTLIEIMVVVIIIGLLAAVVVPQFLNRVDDARVSKAKQDIQAMMTALTMYKLDNYVYPTTDQGLNALIQKPDPAVAPHWRPGGYLQQQHISKDPWGHDYVYVTPGTHGGEYDLYSLGADGQPGGEDTKADIGNWNLDQ